MGDFAIARSCLGWMVWMIARGAMVYDLAEPMGKMFFNALSSFATFAEFEADPLRMRAREGVAAAERRGPAQRECTEAVRLLAGGSG